MRWMDETPRNVTGFKQLHLSTELGYKWYPQRPNREQPAPQNLHANTHVGSLGALGSFQPLVTWVALKCKSERPLAGGARCEGRSDDLGPLCRKRSPWGCGRPLAWGGRRLGAPVSAYLGTWAGGSTPELPGCQSSPCPGGTKPTYLRSPGPSRGPVARLALLALGTTVSRFTSNSSL